MRRNYCNYCGSKLTSDSFEDNKRYLSIILSDDFLGMEKESMCFFDTRDMRIAKKSFEQILHYEVESCEGGKPYKYHTEKYKKLIKSRKLSSIVDYVIENRMKLVEVEILDDFKPRLVDDPNFNMYRNSSNKYYETEKVKFKIIRKVSMYYLTNKEYHYWCKCGNTVHKMDDIFR